jgi:hypothetical protein
VAGLGGGLGGNAPHMLHLGPGSAPLPRSGGGGGASVTLAVPEDKVGVVIGKQGAVINQIKELLGVSIRISKKGEFLPGSHDRACSITGTPEVGHRWRQCLFLRTAAVVDCNNQGCPLMRLPFLYAGSGNCAAVDTAEDRLQRHGMMCPHPCRRSRQGALGPPWARPYFCNSSWIHRPDAPHVC